MRIQLVSQWEEASVGLRRKALRNQGGFSLVEIMVAGCILGYAVVSLFSAYSFGFSLIRLTQESVRADQILVQKLEAVRVYPWDQTAPGAGVILPTFEESYAPGASTPGTTYSGTIAIKDAPVSESYSNTLRQVTVTLNWLSGGTPHTRSMTTFISQNGIQAL